MKKCAVINDISGFGRCSLTAALPVMSVMGVGVNPVVTGVFTNQTDYDSYEKADLTSFLPSFISEWTKLGVNFDGILTGFILSGEQYSYVNSFIDTFKKEGTLLVVDPVMADGGRLYDTYDEKMIAEVRALCKRADVITPNVTELRFLSGEADIEKGALKLLSYGTSAVVVTGIIDADRVLNRVFTAERQEVFDSDYTVKTNVGGSFSGTGDIFSSFVTGKLLCGEDIFGAVSKATDFIAKVIKGSSIKNRNDGIDFELFLKEI